MSELKKFIDKDYLVEFWKRVKTIPGNSNYEAVTGQDVKATKTLIGHIEELYKKINEADDAAIKSVGTDSNYLTVDTESGDVTITLDSEGFAEDLTNDILSAINEVSNGGITITPVEAEGKVTGITIGIDSDTMATINSALQTVETTGYLAGTGVDSANAINIDANQIANATVGDGQELSNDQKKLATKGYVDQQIDGLDTAAVAVAGGKSAKTGATAVSFSKVKNATDEKYYVNLTSNDGSVYDIELDAADFVKDSFLQSVEIGDYVDKSGKNDALIFTWVIDNVDGASAPTQEVTKIKIADFITPYAAGNGISLGDDGHTITAVAKANDYVTVGKDGIQLDSNLVASGTYSKSDSIGNTALTTKGYVSGMISDAIDGVTTYAASNTIVFEDNASDSADYTIKVKFDDLTIKADNDGIYVNIDENDYLETTENGIGINSDKITSTYDSATSAETTNIALVGYVDGAIEAAVGDVTTYEAGSFIEFAEGTNGADKAIKVKVGDGIDSSAGSITVKAADGSINVATNGISVVINSNDYIELGGSGIQLDSDKLANSDDVDSAADTDIALVGYVNEVIENAIDGVTVYGAGDGISFGEEVDGVTPISVNTSGYVTVSGDNIVLDSTKITNGSGDDADTSLATVGYVDEAIAAIPVHEVEYWGGKEDATDTEKTTYATTNFPY